jgi:geranylgeranyl diphosphate synthase, type II
MSAPGLSIDAETLLSQHSADLHEYFKKILARYTQAPARLMESIAYSLYAGGKRLRPTLILESCRACGGDTGAMKPALAAAAAMELIHTFSLVHDDLPAMDNDDLRRGRPTNHKVYGDAMAILAGDAMTTIAFEVLAIDVPAPLNAAMIRELASSTGPEGMIGGQVLDMEGETRKLTLEQLRQLHRMKTGALLTCSCRLGALAAGANADTQNRLATFGAQLGLAFQIVDDVLDETSTPEQMGKATKKDAAKGKNTYPVLLGLEGSTQEAAKALQGALEAIKPLGERAEPLRRIARFVVERTH